MVSGIHTDFVVTEFSDRWFIILSQFEKLGTLVSIIVLTSSLCILWLYLYCYFYLFNVFIFILDNLAITVIQCELWYFY